MMSAAASQILGGLTGPQLLLLVALWLVAMGAGLGLGALIWRAPRPDFRRYELPSAKKGKPAR